MSPLCWYFCSYSTVCGIISFVGYGFVIVVELWGKQWREKSKARFNMH